MPLFLCLYPSETLQTENFLVLFLGGKFIWPQLAVMEHTQTTSTMSTSNNTDFTFESQAARKQCIDFTKSVLAMYEGKIRKFRKAGATFDSSMALKEATWNRNATKNVLNEIFMTKVAK